MSDTEERPTPPVPPADRIPIPEYDWEGGTRVIEPDRQNIQCPACGVRDLYWIVRTTGRGTVFSWDAEYFDPDEFQLHKRVPETEQLNKCESCGWRVYA